MHSYYRLLNERDASEALALLALKHNDSKLKEVCNAPNLRRNKFFAKVVERAMCRNYRQLTQWSCVNLSMLCKYDSTLAPMLLRQVVSEQYVDLLPTMAKALHKCIASKNIDAAVVTEVRNAFYSRSFKR